MTFCLAFLPTGLAAGTQTSGTGWQAEASNVTADLHGVSAVDATTAWAVGDRGTILKTTDSGSTWASQSVEFAPPGSSRIPNYRCVGALDTDAAWASGDYLAFASTADGGAHWLGYATGSSYQQDGCLSIQPLSDTSPWTVLGFSLMVADPILPFVYYVLALRVDTWAAGTLPDNTILTDPNPTAAWSGVGKFLPGWIFTQVSAVDANNAWAVGTAGHIYHFAGGAWTQQTSGINTDLASVSAVDLNTAWAVGAGGIILKTTNGGSSWAPQVSGTTAKLSYISASDSGNAWAVGAGGTILKTWDGGATWKSQDSGTTNNLYSVSSVDPWNAWAVGANGTILHTTDGGAGPPTVSGVDPSSAANLFMAGVTVSGTGFVPGASVKLTSGTTVIDAIGVSVASDAQLTCFVVLNGQPLGKYDVVVKNPDGQEGKLAGGFSVTNVCGQGAGASITVFAGLLGLLSLAGFGRRRGRR